MCPVERKNGWQMSEQVGYPNPNREHLTFVISIYTYYNKSYISGLLAKIGFSNWIPKPELFPTDT
jgi:hypothetical protein